MGAGFFWADVVRTQMFYLAAERFNAVVSFAGERVDIFADLCDAVRRRLIFLFRFF